MDVHRIARITVGATRNADEIRAARLKVKGLRWKEVEVPGIPLVVFQVPGRVPGEGTEPLQAVLELISDAVVVSSHPGQAAMVNAPLTLI